MLDFWCNPKNTPAKLDDVFYYGFSEKQVLDLAGQRSMAGGEGRIIAR
jgi:hypothetical protein